MAEVSKGDLMFFQNEILSDIKKLESKINLKIDKQIEDLKQKIIHSEKTTKNLIKYYNFIQKLKILHQEIHQKQKNLKKILEI